MLGEDAVNTDGYIFSIDTNGSGFQILINFDTTTGSFPTGSLALSGNVLYGMTDGGGASFSGIIYSIDTNGSDYKKND